jgi:hypothetical protein
MRLAMVKTLRRIPRNLLFFLAALACFWVEAPIHAKPKITPEIKEVARHKMLVTFSWEVTVQSDKASDGCDLKISFHDAKGNEIYAVKEVIALKVGRNSFNGTEICSVDVWKRVAKYVTTLDCVF